MKVVDLVFTYAWKKKNVENGARMRKLRGLEVGRVLLQKG